VFRDKCGCCLGICTCFMVVFVFALLHTTIFYTPLTFLTDYEQRYGQMDLRIEPRANAWVNYTAILDILAKNPTGKSFNTSTMRRQRSVNDGAFLVGASPDKLAGSARQHVELLDISAEHDIALGDRSTIGKLAGPTMAGNEILLSTALAEDIGVQKADTVWVQVDSGMMQLTECAMAVTGHGFFGEKNVEKFGSIAGDDDENAFWKGYRSPSDHFVSTTLKQTSYPLSFKYIVKGIYNDTLLKFRDFDDADEDDDTAIKPPAAIVDVRGYYDRLMLEGNATTVEAFKTVLPTKGDFTPAKVAQRCAQIYRGDLVVNLPAPRHDTYLMADYEALQKIVVDYFSSVLVLIGFPAWEAPSLQILRRMQVAQFIQLFLGLTLNLFILILVVLSIVLIYSLLLVSVETRQLEMGILRTLGVNRKLIIQIVFSQAFSYAVPGWIVGLALAQMVAEYTLTQLSETSGVRIPTTLRPESAAWATVLILIVPVVATYIPAKKALTSSLAEAMNTNRASTKAVVVDIIRDNNKQLNLPLMLVALALTGFGFTVYYLFPLALLSLDLALLLSIFLLILMGMLVGLVLLSLNFEGVVEQAVVYVFVGILCCTKRAVKGLVLKNLVAHRQRNRKTTLMYSIALGFIIFAQTAYDVNIRTVLHAATQSRGAPVVLFSLGYKGVKHMDELEKFLNEHDQVVSWAFASAPIPDIYSVDPAGRPVGNLVSYNSTQTSNVGRSVVARTRMIYAVSPNWHEATWGEYLRISDEYRPDTALTPYQKLYTAEGSGSALMPTAFLDGLGVDVINRTNRNPQSNATADPALIETTYFPDASGFGATFRYGMLNAMALLNAAPGLFFSQFPSRINGGHVVVSFPTLARLLGGNIIGGARSIPVDRVLIWTKKAAQAETSTASGSEPGYKDDFLKQLESVADTGGLVGQSSNGDSAVNGETGMSVKGTFLGVGETQAYDLTQRFKRIETQRQILAYIFDFSILVVMVLCFFSVSSSMATNIHEQRKEIAVLRAIGMQNSDLMRLYTREAFALVFSASIMGMMIGTAVAWTMTLQRFIFTEIYVPFIFPTSTFMVVLITAFVSGIGASYVPAKALLRMPVAKAFKSAD